MKSQLFIVRFVNVTESVFVGKKLVAEGAQESTNVSVQTIAKYTKGNKNGPTLPVFNADASKVTVKGMGIKKAFIGKQNQFTVNASEAGKMIFFFLAQEYYPSFLYSLF